MAYNPRLYLLRVIEIQDIVIKEKKRGSTQIWIYNNLIVDRYKISYSTFNNYLSVNAKKQLAELSTQTNSFRTKNENGKVPED